MHWVAPRLLLPIAACAVSAGAAVVGGACRFYRVPQPTLHDGSYGLSTANGTVPPVRITDSAGRQLRVIADTIQFSLSAHTYSERTLVAITPPGGTEQSPTIVTVAARTYSTTGSTTFDLSATIAGAVHADIVADNTIELRIPNGTYWLYTLR